MVIEAKEVLGRLKAAQELVSDDTTTRAKFEAVRKLVKGVNPRVDKALGEVNRALKIVGQIEKEEIIDLTAENWPERTKEEKKRKKAVLLLIKWWKQLKGEINRVEQEFKSQKTNKWERVVIKAKGPVGIITVAAIIIVGAKIWFSHGSTPFSRSPLPTPSPIPQKQTIQAIKVGDKFIPVIELTTAVGAECDGEHYHAKDHVAAVAIDDSKVMDPGGCGFGKVSEVKVETIEAN